MLIFFKYLFDSVPVWIPTSIVRFTIPVWIQVFANCLYKEIIRLVGGFKQSFHQAHIFNDIDAFEVTYRPIVIGQ